MSRKKLIRVVIVEDDLFFNKSLTRYVNSVCSTDRYPELEFEIQTYYNAHDCLKSLKKDTSILFLDYYLLNIKKRNILSGADVLARVKKKGISCKVIMVSSLKNIQTAVELMRRGIYEYVNKNRYAYSKIGDVLKRILEEETKQSPASSMRQNTTAHILP